MGLRPKGDMFLTTQGEKMDIKRRIKREESQFQKIIEAYGLRSDAALGAFFKFQAAKMGIPEKESFAWASAEVERLQKKDKEVFLKCHAN